MDVVATGPHLLEPERLELHRLRAAPGDRVHADLGELRAVELPDLVAFGRLDDARGTVGEVRRYPALEHVRGLDDVVVDRDHGVANLTG